MERLGRQADLNPEERDTVITVGLGSCGVFAGALKTLDRLKELIQERRLRARVTFSGCMGMCYREPLVWIKTKGSSVLYGGVGPQEAERLIQEHLIKGGKVEELLVLDNSKITPENEFLQSQVRILLENCGIINPERIEEYLKVGGYEALKKVLRELSPQEVIDMVKASGLRGRGGAGFPTGVKWSFAARASGDEKYFICNLDEGDQGTFVDRVIAESDPHKVIEGMAIGAFAMGANKGYIYCKTEYPLAMVRMAKAIQQARENGFLGEGIAGSDFSFDIEIREGAGAYVCGEETALIESIEGKRGVPRLRPPFPANVGLWGKPTNVNNLETIANIPWIIKNGPEKFNQIGMENNRGTKLFSVTGDVLRSGVIEVPLGMTLREVVFDILGGPREGRELKAIQIGGSLGGFVPPALLDTPLSFESLQEIGAVLGSGGMVILDDTRCLVDVIQFLAQFNQQESCGKCVPCRIGTVRVQEILSRIVRGEGSAGDLEGFRELSEVLELGSICGLGQGAPRPMTSALRHFRDEFVAHIEEKRCPAKVCPGESSVLS